MKVTNYSKAKQGIRVKGRIVYVAPDETKDIDPTADEKKRLSKHPAFSKDGKPVADESETVKPETEVEETDEEKAEEVKDVDEKDALIAQLKDLGVSADRRSSVDTLKAKLEEAKAE